MKKLRVTIEGKVYDVLVEVLDGPDGEAASTKTPTPKAPNSAGPVMPVPIPAPATSPVALNGATKAEGGDIPCPLAGKVVSIDVKLGDVVHEGSQVATVEAMKMNTYIYAPKNGKVTSILVNPGDGVEEGAALLRIA